MNLINQIPNLSFSFLYPHLFRFRRLFWPLQRLLRASPRTSLAPQGSRRCSVASSATNLPPVSLPRGQIELKGILVFKWRKVAFVAGLVSVKGHKPSSRDEKWPLYFTIGTMTRYAEDLPLMMKIIAQTEEGRRRFHQKVALSTLS